MQNILIGLGVVVVVGGGVYVYTNSNATISEENMEAEAPREEQTSPEDFATIMAAGESVYCTVTHEENGNRTEGSIYLADRGERIRGHFVVTGAVNTEMHMIRNNETNYMWGPAFPQGIKIAVTAENRNTLFENNENKAVPDTVSFTCDAWDVDDSKFRLPNDVTFMDMQAQMDVMVENMQGSGSTGFEGTTDMKAIQCGACDQAGEARAQCRAALGCES